MHKPSPFFFSRWPLFSKKIDTADLKAQSFAVLPSFFPRGILLLTSLFWRIKQTSGENGEESFTLKGLMLEALFSWPVDPRSELPEKKERGRGLQGEEEEKFPWAILCRKQHYHLPFFHPSCPFLALNICIVFFCPAQAASGRTDEREREHGRRRGAAGELAKKQAKAEPTQIFR